MYVVVAVCFVFLNLSNMQGRSKPLVFVLVFFGSFLSVERPFFIGSFFSAFFFFSSFLFSFSFSIIITLLFCFTISLSLSLSLRLPLSLSHESFSLGHIKGGIHRASQFTGR